MPLSWNEIRSRAVTFSKKWEGEASERAEAQSFWNDFFAIFGIERRRIAIFEKQVVLARGADTIAKNQQRNEHKQLKHGRIDAFWKGMLLIEHKSANQDLDRAFTQAADYFDGLPERDLPRYILVSDFARFRLHDLEAKAGEPNEIHFNLTDLHKHIKRFGFIAGYQAVEIKPQDPVNIKAAEKMGRLHDALKASGYDGHPLEVLLVRLLFCLFADDTGIFYSAQVFRSFIEERTRDDGSDVGAQLALLFQVLNTPEAKRANTLDELFKSFPYVNGKLFEEPLLVASFDTKMRDALLDCAKIDWATISPAIFGALFQSIMNAEARRNLGAHYTSEENILKLIKPLFLDQLWADVEKIKNNKNKLFEFHKQLRSLTFFDPACGCGNFLVITYREIRLLELAVLRASLAIEQASGQRLVSVMNLVSVDVDQFYGIEIEEFPAQIAQVAMWLIDHQMNVKVGEEFGQYFTRIPLKTSPHIVHGNALTIDWATVLPPERCSYVMGNPPFVGSKFMSDAQRADVTRVFVGIDKAGLLDFVCAWYVSAARYIKQIDHPALAGGVRLHAPHDFPTRCAFVSTNSITQGEQVGVLWAWLLAQGIKIQFAHRTFAWTNEARGKAAVHCVIIGFGSDDVERKVIYEYEDIRGEAHPVVVSNINPYLVDAPDVLLIRRTKPIGKVPRLHKGNQPTDGGNLILSPSERNELLAKHPDAEKFIKQLMGAREFLNNELRYCLWLVDAKPNELRKFPWVLQRVEQCEKWRREAGNETDTKALADTPTLFRETYNPTSYCVVPEVSSERRRYIPIGFLDGSVIPTNKLQIIEEVDIYVFGVMCSAMHMAWTNAVCGRMKSDYQYSAQIVYNNFPWPDHPTAAATQKIEAAAQAVLDARAVFADASLADLYDPLTMPPQLVKAHQTLDAAVDAAYGRRAFNNDAERVAFLFTLYQQYTSILPLDVKPKKKYLKRQSAKTLTNASN